MLFLLLIHSVKKSTHALKVDVFMRQVNQFFAKRSQ